MPPTRLGWEPHASRGTYDDTRRPDIFPDVTSFAVHPFLTGLALTFGVSLALFVASWLLAVRIGRYNVVDVVWGLSFVAIAVTSFLWSAGHGADTWRRVLVLVLVSIWGVRLSAYIGVRSRGKGEDPRYDAMLGDGPNRALRALGIVFVLQAVVAWFISLPVQAAMYIRPGWRRSPSSASRSGSSGCSSRRSATRRWAPSATTPPTRARSWTAACGATPATRTTSATPPCGPACTSSPPSTGSAP